MFDELADSVKLLLARRAADDHDLSGAVFRFSQVRDADFARVRFFRRFAGRAFLPRAEFTSLFGEGL
jgi:hypothetical protein